MEKIPSKRTKGKQSVETGGKKEHFSYFQNEVKTEQVMVTEQNVQFGTETSKLAHWE